MTRPLHLIIKEAEEVAKSKERAERILKAISEGRVRHPTDKEVSLERQLLARRLGGQMYVIDDEAGTKGSK